MKSKNLWNELPWLAGIALLTVILVNNIGFQGQNNTIDIQLHDTYYVLDKWSIGIALAAFIGFFVYFFKGLRNSFTMPIQNLIVIILGISTIIGLSVLLSIFSKDIHAGFTVNPPASATEKSNQFDDPSGLLLALHRLTIGVLIVVGIAITVIGYKWVKSRKK